MLHIYIWIYKWLMIIWTFVRNATEMTDVIMHYSSFTM